MKIIAKILLAIAIIWTLIFIFKLGNSFALSPDYEKQIYNNCYQDAKTSLGAKRAKQYCTCTTTMLDNKYSDEEILNIAQKSASERTQAFAFATNHCNKNANATSNNQSELSNEIVLQCVFDNGHNISGGQKINYPKGFKGTHDISILLDTNNKKIINFNDTEGFLAKNQRWSSSQISWRLNFSNGAYEDYKLNRTSGQLNIEFETNTKKYGTSYYNYYCDKSQQKF